MFKSRLVDNTDYCDVLKHSLADDLLPFSLSDSSILTYSDNTNGDLTSKYSEFINIIKKYSPEPKADDRESSAFFDIWQPYFITDDDLITTKMLSSYGSYHNQNASLQSARLGIESFFNFTGKFKSFSNTSNMSIDWIINHSNIPYFLYYGIMCWFRYNNTSSNPYIIDGQAEELSAFPNGSRVTPTTNLDKVYIKLNNEKLYDITTTTPSKKFENGSWVFNAESGSSIVDLASLLPRSESSVGTTTLKFKIAHKEKRDGTIINNNEPVTLWVPNGDCFYYYDSNDDYALSRTYGIPPKSYVSSSLHKIYSFIYRIITLDEKRTFGSKKLTRSRLYRNLAHALSTSPFITDFSIKSLDTPEIRSIIQDYVSTARTSFQLGNIGNSLSLLRNVLISISSILQNGGYALGLDTKFSKNTIHNNIIRNKGDLFYKLLSKYGAYAKITTPTTFTAKTLKLNVDNKGISVFQIAEHYCNKTLTNQTVYNNQTITLDNISISTDLSATSGALYITNSNITDADNPNKIALEIPLYNHIRPSFNTSFFMPYIAYTGYVQAAYRNDGRIFHPEITQEDIVGQKDKIYYAQLDWDAETKLASDPNSSHISDLSDMEPFSALQAIGDIPGIPGLVNADNNDNGITLIGCIFEGVDRMMSGGGTVKGLPDSYLEKNISAIWEQVDGKPGYFGKSKLQVGLGNIVQFYPLYTGKYSFKCTLSTPFGSFIKHKTFYVVDGRDTKNQYGKYWNPITKSWAEPPAPNTWASNEQLSNNIPSLIDSDKILCNIAKMNTIVINNIVGVFVPVQTDLIVRRQIGSLGTSASVNEDIIDNLTGNTVFKFNNDFVFKSIPQLSVQFKPNNTTIKLYSIWLERIRTDDPKCSQCFSMYYPRLKSVKSNSRVVTDDTGSAIERNYNKIYRDNKFPEGFTLSKYTSDTVLSGYKFESYKDFIFPQISNKFGPKVKTYGGYSRKFINDVGIQINGLTPPAINAADENLISSSPIILPSVTGFPLNTPNMLYYQKSIPFSGAGLKINFTKGIFSTSSGWIPYSGGDLYKNNNNRSSVLKFNPGARDTFSFIGPQINRLRPGSVIRSGDQIYPKTFSSSIVLGISEGVQWESSECSSIFASENKDNQNHKNYVDIKTNDRINSNHGYRILHGGEPKSFEFTSGENTPSVNDEFETIQEPDTFYYKFPVTGPFSLIKLTERIPRVNNFGIKDIEIKLNFLNYVNTKNLVIWLDVEYCPKEIKTRFSSSVSPLIASGCFLDQIHSSKIFYGSNYTQNQSKILIESNDDINRYSVDLLKMNSASGALDNNFFKLVLLNQETIYHNGYNFNLKFSDHASKYNVLNDIKIFENYYSAESGSNRGYLLSPVQIKQDFVKSNGEVLPSIAATGFSDRESCYYSSTIKFNKLNITNNTLSKFISDSLFKNAQGRLNGSTKFTLNIMVVDDEDDMSPLDNTITTQYLSELETVKNVEKSRLLYNSLCSWELILHTEKERNFIPETNPGLTSYGNNDILSLLDYKNGLAYTGYSFIADLKNYKHLLPLANYDAPNNCISDINICGDPQNDPTGQTNMQRPPTFPNYAILAIIASTAGIAGMGGMGAVGVLAGIAGINNDASYKAIIDFFREASFANLIQHEMRNIYKPNFEKYPFGSPEKILINFKTPNSLWHTAEASIFKYHNTPILKPNEYEFIRLSRATSFGKFNCSNVKSYKDLIDDIFIIDVTGIRIGDTLNPPVYLENRIINSGDILYNTKNSGLYLAEKTALEIYSPSSTDTSNYKFDLLNRSPHYINHNAVLSFNGSGLWDKKGAIITDISNNKVIMMSGRIPYDIFMHRDPVILMSGDNVLRSTINKKALIFKNNTYNSAFVLSDTVPAGYNVISPHDDSSIFFVYKNETTIQDKTKSPYNVWGLDDKTRFKHSPSDITTTTNSVGSYGDMSMFVDKNVLSNNIQSNQLKNIYQILNNNDNDRIKNTKISLYTIINSGTLNEQKVKIKPTNTTYYDYIPTSGTFGFSYNQEEFKNLGVYRKEQLYRDVFIAANYDTEDKLFNNTVYSSAYKNIPNNFSIIRTYFNTPLPSSVLSGIMEVENDYYEYIPIGSITSTQLTTLTNQLNVIQNTGIYNTLEEIIGKSDSTQTILDSNKLNYIEKHYNALPADPTGCHRPGNTSSKCNKLKTYAKIQDLYRERDSIIKLLNEQTVIIGGNRTLRSSLPDTHPLKINTDILPKIIPVISGTQNLTISYNKVNEDHYWINLDPNQGCFADFESNPKVLVSTTYYCQPQNALLTEYKDMDNNICSQKVSKNMQGENISFEHDISGGVDFPPFPATHKYVYKIAESYINEEMTRLKNLYGSAFTEWKEVTKTRYFNINGDPAFDDIPQEVVIMSIEKYKVPVVTYPVATHNTTDNLDLAGMAPCLGSNGSPGGKGLLKQDMTRVGKAVTIANTVNLSNINNISVMIKKIPRMLRGTDLLSTMYRPGAVSDYRQITRNPPAIPIEVDESGTDGSINNSLYVWFALEIQPGDTLRYAQELPDFLKLQNEMIFRSFFGSVDRIENKTPSIVPGYPWEIIPYEYDRNGA